MVLAGQARVHKLLQPRRVARQPQRGGLDGGCALHEEVVGAVPFCEVVGSGSDKSNAANLRSGHDGGLERLHWQHVVPVVLLAAANTVTQSTVGAAQDSPICCCMLDAQRALDEVHDVAQP